MAIGPIVSAKLKVKALLVDDPVDEPTFICKSAAVLSAIRSLPPDENLVLFTPVLPPARPLEPGELPTDPFEAFGRALSKSHRRIQHVPFVPSVGLTETHAAFLSEASAVIAVACDAAGRGSSVTTAATAGDISRGIVRFREQVAFARALQQVVGSPSGEPDDVVSGMGPPPVLLVLVEGPMIQESPADIGSFDTILRCSSYRQEMLVRAANAILDPPVLTKSVPDRSRFQGS
jgi:hypothetical protein